MIVVALSATGSKHKNTAASTPKPSLTVTPTPTPAPATSAAGLPSAGVSSGPAPAPATSVAKASTKSVPKPSPTSAKPDPHAAQQAAIKSWAADGGLDKITAIGTDLTNTSKAAQDEDTDALQTFCGVLQSDVEDAQQYDPIPAKEIQTPWGEALSYFARAAGDCIAGVTSLDTSILQKTTDELNTGTNYLDQASTALEKFVPA